jgi:DNA polymerase-3 subunit gamma/tau
MATILSRLRPYRFLARSADEEYEIIRRVFRDKAFKSEEKTSSGIVESYLDSFLPQSSDKLLPLAAFFVAAVARAAAILAKNRCAGNTISPAIKALGSYCAPIAEAAEFERLSDTKEVVAVLLSRSGNFEGQSFPRFLALVLDLVSWSFSQHSTEQGSSFIASSDIWRKFIGEAQAACNVWNQKPEAALESLFHKLREELAD